MNYFEDHKKLVSPDTSHAEMFMIANRYMSFYKVYRERFIKRYGFLFKTLEKVRKENNKTLFMRVYMLINSFIEFATFADLDISALKTAIDRKLDEMVE